MAGIRKPWTERYVGQTNAMLTRALIHSYICNYLLGSPKFMKSSVTKKLWLLFFIAFSCDCENFEIVCA